MSLMRMWGMRSVLASFAEMVFFFCILTPAYFLVLALAYLVVTGGFGSVEPAAMHEAISLIGALPLWVVLLLGFGYLLLIIFYWTPGETKDCGVELQGFAVFLAVVLVVGGLMLQWRFSAFTAIF